MPPITACLWFDDKAEEAARFYVSTLRDGKIGTIAHTGPSSAEMSGRPVGSVMTVAFEAEGQQFLALNGGPQFSFDEAVSFIVYRDTQEEIDEVWAALCEGGTEGPCGWLKDRFGLSWQVVPSIVPELMASSDAEQAERAMQAILKMTKLDVAAIERAVAGVATPTS